MAVDISVPLDELISSKLGALSLRDDEEMVDFVKGLVEEDSFEPEVRKGCAAIGAVTDAYRRTGPEERYLGHDRSRRGGRFVLFLPLSSRSGACARSGMPNDLAMLAETTSTAVDELLGETTAYQEAVAAKRREQEEAKAPAKGAPVPLDLLAAL